MITTAIEINKVQAWECRKKGIKVYAYDPENQIDFELVTAKDLVASIKAEHVLYIDK